MVLWNHSFKSFMRTFSVHIKKFKNRFNWLTTTNKIRNKITSGNTNDIITYITETDRFSSFKCFDELANTAVFMDITFSYIIGTDRFTSNWWFGELPNTNNLTDIRFSCITRTNLTTTTGVTDIKFSCVTGTDTFPKV